MHHNAQPGPASEADALSLRTKVFAAMGVALVLCLSSYSFIAVGRAFAAQDGTHLCAWGETEESGMPSRLGGLGNARGICISVPAETEGAASKMWGWKGFHVYYAHQIHLTSNAWR
jgi:hypothetical protein